MLVERIQRFHAALGSYLALGQPMGLNSPNIIGHREPQTQASDSHIFIAEANILAERCPNRLVTKELLRKDSNIFTEEANILTAPCQTNQSMNPEQHASNLS